MKPKGAIALITVILIGALMTMSVITLTLSGIGTRFSQLALFHSERVFAAVEGCAEEGLLQLARDAGYSGGNFTVGEVECEIGLGGSEEEKTLVVTGSADGITRNLMLTVQLTPAFGILNFAD